MKYRLVIISFFLAGCGAAPGTSTSASSGSSAAAVAVVSPGSSMESPAPAPEENDFSMDISYPQFAYELNKGVADIEHEAASSGSLCSGPTLKKIAKFTYALALDDPQFFEARLEEGARKVQARNNSCNVVPDISQWAANYYDYLATSCSVGLVRSGGQILWAAGLNGYLQVACI